MEEHQEPSEAVTEEHALNLHLPTSRKHTLMALGAFLIFIMFWDSILGIVTHGFLYVLEYLELFTEELLELVFHLEGHTAQIFTAWIGFAAFSALLTWGYLSLRRAFIRRFRDRQYFKLWLRHWAKEHWIWIALSVILYLLIIIFL